MSLNKAMGKEESDDVPTVNVPGAQSDMRESEGCMRSCLSAFRRPVG